MKWSGSKAEAKSFAAKHTETHLPPKWTSYSVRVPSLEMLNEKSLFFMFEKRSNNSLINAIQQNSCLLRTREIKWTQNTNTKCEFIMNSWTKRSRKKNFACAHTFCDQHCLPFDDGLLVRCSRSGSRQRRAIEMKYSVERGERVEYATLLLRCPLPMPRKCIQLHLCFATMLWLRLFLCPRKPSAEHSQKASRWKESFSLIFAAI